jgi:hypothetical protein
MSPSTQIPSRRRLAFRNQIDVDRAATAAERFLFATIRADIKNLAALSAGKALNQPLVCRHDGREILRREGGPAIIVHGGIELPLVHAGLLLSCRKACFQRRNMRRDQAP